MKAATALPLILAAALAVAGCKKEATGDQVNASEANAAATADANSSGNATAAATSTGPLTGTPAEIAAAREKKFKEIGKNNKPIGEELKKPSPDVAAIAPHAKVIAELAADQPNWFPAGSGPDAAPKTHALPAVWQKPDEFKAKMADFKTAADALNASASGGDLAKVKTDAAALGKTCKSCHDEFRAKDDDHK